MLYYAPFIIYCLILDFYVSGLIKSVKTQYIMNKYLILFITILFCLGLTLFIIYQICFGSVILCDGGESLFDLKMNLTGELHSYRVHIANYEYFTDSHNQMVNRPGSERNIERELIVLDSANRVLIDLNETYSKIRSIEGRIRIIEPGFQSPLQAINYLRVTR